MCDVGVKKFTIFFKIKIYKKTCKKFCRLQKDLYLCSVNKKTTKHMRIKLFIERYVISNVRANYRIAYSDYCTFSEFLYSPYIYWSYWVTLQSK